MEAQRVSRVESSLRNFRSAAAGPSTASAAADFAQDDSTFIERTSDLSTLGGFGLEEVQGPGQDIVDFVGWGVFVIIVGG